MADIVATSATGEAEGERPRGSGGAASRWLLTTLVLPYIRAELPGWGRVYRSVVGGRYRDNDWWAGAAP
jgi:hypothetical protein